MKLSDLLRSQPPVKTTSRMREQIRDGLVRSGKKLVVIDDDPTGMQAVHGVDVYMDWSVNTLRKALKANPDVFFVSVNSRSLNAPEAEKLGVEVGRNLRQAVDREEVQIRLASRSDSTLRGHFPIEVEALMAGFGLEPDAVILAPALLEAGRYTINDIQWAEQGGEVVPVGETEFARDPMFAFKSSDLKDWVEEKTKGGVKAEDAISISLRALREGGPEEVVKILMTAANRIPIIINAASYEDLDTAALAIQSAEEKGKIFIYRCSASFIKSRGGFPDRALLTHAEMVSGTGPGLIVAGSYVEKTSRQIKQLVDAELVVGVELGVGRILDDRTRESEIESVLSIIDGKFDEGATVALYTTRQVSTSANKDFAMTGKSITQALCDIVKRVTSRPAYMITKGGITSIEVARNGLGVEKAYAMGQIQPGVPVWRLGDESRWPGMTYVVFPGNVGDEGALVRAVEELRIKNEDSRFKNKKR